MALGRLKLSPDWKSLKCKACRKQINASHQHQFGYIQKRSSVLHSSMFKGLYLFQGGALIKKKQPQSKIQNLGFYNDQMCQNDIDE